MENKLFLRLVHLTAVWILSPVTRKIGAVWFLFFLMDVFVENIEAQQDQIIDQILIEGNSSIPDTRIRGLLQTQPEGIFKSGRLNNTIWLTDLDAIESFYRNSGFLDARVRAVRERKNSNNILLRIVIDEGLRYYVREVNLKGFHYLDKSDIKKSLLTREGDVFYRLFAATDKRYIQSQADTKALIDMTVETKILLHEEDRTVTVGFEVVEGYPIQVGSVLVQGLQKTKKRVVIRELELRSGDLYNNEKISLSQARLFQTGLFRSVRLSPVRTDSLSTVRNLLVNVTELPGGEVSFGAGFASAERFRGSYSIAYRNWLGRGITIGTNGQISSLLQQIESGITQPWLFQTRTIGSIRAFFRRENRISHIERELGVSATVNRELSRAFRGQLIYTLKKVKISSLSDELTNLIQNGTVVDSLRSRREGSLTQIVAYDTRDDILNPKTGFYGQLESSLATPVLGSSTQNRNSILTFMAVVRKYLSLPNMPQLSTSLSLSYVRALDNNLIPLDRKLFIGGDRSVRGFGINQIGQPDGGLIAINSQNEIRIPLSRITVALFIDWGGIGKTVETLGLNNFLLGYGGGVRVNSPIGLIRSDVGFHQQGLIDRPNSGLYDRTFFYFGLGQAF